jgi:pimeloyl-ACP methyl ester carboxylesterase
MGFHERTFLAPDGLRLYVRVYEPASPAGNVVCLSGLTRNSRDFHGLALHLSQRAERPFRVVAMDYRGRGMSAYDPDFTRYNVMTEAEDVLAGCAALGVDHAHFIGTSRGGIIIHLLGAMRPAMIKSIVLNDIGPVIEGIGLMQIKGYLDRAPRPTDWGDAARVQRAVHGKEFPALGEDDWQVHARAIYREDAKGKVVADFDPELVKTLTEIDPHTPLPALWAQFSGLSKMPILSIRGENSRLLSKETVDQMAKMHPGMHKITVIGQGHAPMLWTDGLPEKISTFLG